ncbi:hypothetical protein SAMN05421759_10979 [Roseivivax lentus]|uniref:Tellurium resistance protein n=1 Tax=Roseivivax lentus TaxID=633194 RepID=A0A1N7NP86_9RHOB|nr:TrgA family protein [Roseivivax lentus]SIT00127.1 hypothetical protein SAMN05421759_10979 [Roseivivax lentus]
MPTAPKLVAGLLLAALAYVASEMVKPLMPSSTVFGWFSEVNLLIGFVVGWRQVGSGAGRGTAAAISNGVTGTFTMVVSCLAVHAINTMVEDSFDRKFRTVFEAINAAIGNFLEYGAVLLSPGFLGLFVLGAVIIGMATEISGHYWR